MSQYQRPNIQRMQGYRWGEQPEDDQCIKLNTNENPYPPSPAVAQALADFASASLRTYPQPTADKLREQIAKLHNLDKEHVVVTHAGDEALRQPSPPLSILAQLLPAQIQAIPCIPCWPRYRTPALSVSS